jgi:hypothetical protein
MLDRLRRMELVGPVVRADFRHSRRTLPSDFQARMVHVIERCGFRVHAILRTSFGISPGKC